MLIYLFSRLRADFNKMHGRIIGFEFYRFGLIPLSLFFAITSSIYLNLNVSKFILLHLVLVLLFLILRRREKIKTSSKKISISDIRKRSFPFFITSLGTSIFSVLDIVLAAIFFTPKEVAIYSIMTRAAIIFMMPLNFFSAKYHVPIIKAFKNGDETSLQSEIKTKKILSALALVFATITIYWSNYFFYSDLEKILEGLGDALVLLPAVMAMIIIRMLCFDYVTKLNFCISPSFFAKLTAINNLSMLALVFLIGSALSIFQYTILIASFGIMPSLISMVMIKASLKS